MAISDKILTEALQALHRTRVDFDAYYFMSLFPDYDKITQHLTIDKLAKVLPELKNQTDKTIPFSIRLSPSGSVKENDTQRFLINNNKVSFDQG